jgi:hypothetical protein
LRKRTSSRVLCCLTFGFLGTLWTCRHARSLSSTNEWSMKSRHEGAIRILPEELLGFKNLLSFASHKWKVNRWLAYNR